MLRYDTDLIWDSLNGNTIVYKEYLKVIHSHIFFLIRFKISIIKYSGHFESSQNVFNKIFLYKNVQKIEIFIKKIVILFKKKM